MAVKSSAEIVKLGHNFADIWNRCDTRFCWSRGAAVGDKIRNSKVNFMANGADNWYF